MKSPRPSAVVLGTYETGLGVATDVRALYLSPSVDLSPDETAHLLGMLPGLRWAYSARTGTDHLALDLFRERGVTVSNVGDLNCRWVAEMNLACIVAQAKRLPEHVLARRLGRRRSCYCESLRELTVAIVGTGRIGQETAGAAFHRRVLRQASDRAWSAYDSRLTAVHR